MEISDDQEHISSGPTAVPILDPPRENLIRTASKFLQNPRVRRTTLVQKQNFLRQKGLTEEEIQLACEHAGIFLEDQNMTTNHLMPSRKPFQYRDEKRLSLWVKAKDIANLVALISIGSYSLYSFWKSYIAPRFFGTRSRHEQNYEKLLVSIGKLNESVEELKELLRTMQQASTLSQRPNSSFATIKSGTASEIHDIRNELASIKGLLLNRSQFPSSPGIPSWQMLENEELDESGSSEGQSRRNRRERKLSQRKLESDSASVVGEAEGEASSTSIPNPIRKHPSLDSNNGFHSGGSSCEVVFVGKNDSNSDPDHSDD